MEKHDAQSMVGGSRSRSRRDRPGRVRKLVAQHFQRPGRLQLGVAGQDGEHQRRHDHGQLGRALDLLVRDRYPDQVELHRLVRSFWPPVKGPVTAASGASLPGTFGTITRADGTVQATYMGHPLYTYVADSSAGMVSGNGKNLSGGFWWAMTPSGA